MNAFLIESALISESADTIRSVMATRSSFAVMTRSPIRIIHSLHRHLQRALNGPLIPTSRGWNWSVVPGGRRTTLQFISKIAARTSGPMCDGALSKRRRPLRPLRYGRKTYYWHSEMYFDHPLQHLAGVHPRGWVNREDSVRWITATGELPLDPSIFFTYMVKYYGRYLWI